MSKTKLITAKRWVDEGSLTVNKYGFLIAGPEVYRALDRQYSSDSILAREYLEVWLGGVRPFNELMDYMRSKSLGSSRERG